MAKPLAVCDRKRGAHILARIIVRDDGRRVIKYSAGMYSHSGDAAGKASLKWGGWAAVGLDSEDARISTADLYCNACGRQYPDVRIADLATVFRTKGDPLVLSSDTRIPHTSPGSALLGAKEEAHRKQGQAALEAKLRRWAAGDYTPGEAQANAEFLGQFPVQHLRNMRNEYPQHLGDTPK